MSTEPTGRAPGSITATVLAAEHDTLARITAEPFLAGLASGTLPKSCLEAWLREDWHFVKAMRRSIGLLVASAPDERTVDVVAGAFRAIRAELDHFEAEIGRRGIDASAPPAPLVANFNEALRRSLGSGPESAIATFWIVEYAYWWAWSQVRAKIGTSGQYGDWVDRWSSPGFGAYVDQLGDLVDANSDLETARAIASDVLARELALWKYLWQIGVGPPAI